jgi:hypothetical protein
MGWGSTVAHAGSVWNTTMQTAAQMESDTKASMFMSRLQGKLGLESNCAAAECDFEKNLGSNIKNGAPQG